MLFSLFSIEMAVLEATCTGWQGPLHNDTSSSNVTNGSFRVNSTNFCKSSQVSISNIAQKIPKITLVSIMKACQILGCNSEYFWRKSLSNFRFAFLPSRL